MKRWSWEKHLANLGNGSNGVMGTLYKELEPADIAGVENSEAKDPEQLSTEKHKTDLRKLAPEFFYLIKLISKAWVLKKNIPLIFMQVNAASHSPQPTL